MVNAQHLFQHTGMEWPCLPGSVLMSTGTSCSANWISLVLLVETAITKWRTSSICSTGIALQPATYYSATFTTPGQKGVLLLLVKALLLLTMVKSI